MMEGFLVKALCCEELLDQRDAQVARQRLEEIRSGDAEVVSAEDVARELGL
ncbi:hypothetical protein [Nocardiopsis sp. SBT366]|uniref:hypothetical protein n=1 Tax=Nocardiopsis sp. SBT366 TaxID=1580529 RepID=UPI0018F8ACAC|nr:hypothetical protein [Nocardiopsis sp. SBT366]